MRSYFVRHTIGLRVIDEAIDYLWENHKIAIHYPERKRFAADLTSLDPRKYESREARAAIATFNELNEEGGYVWAQYRYTPRYPDKDHVRVKVGKVPRGSFLIYPTRWVTREREAKLKTLTFDTIREIQPGEGKDLRRIRPKAGTIFRWPAAGDRLASLLEECHKA